MFVYLITNIINGKRYVGQTTNSLECRWAAHQKSKNCRYLYAAINKYGKDNFTIESICEPPTIDLMNEFEAEYIHLYNTLVPNGYNLTEGGRVPRHNSDTRKKMSESHKGFRPPFSFRESWTPEMRKSAGLRSAVRFSNDEYRAKMSMLFSGDKNPNAKLTFEQAQEIRRLYLTNEYTQTELAIKFSVDQVSVSRIVLNQAYKFLPGGTPKCGYPGE
jgi:group I intron endonuclease